MIDVISSVAIDHQYLQLHGLPWGLLVYILWLGAEAHGKQSEKTLQPQKFLVVPLNVSFLLLFRKVPWKLIFHSFFFYLWNLLHSNDTLGNLLMLLVITSNNRTGLKPSKDNLKQYSNPVKKHRPVANVMLIYIHKEASVSHVVCPRFIFK